MLNYICSLIKKLTAELLDLSPFDNAILSSWSASSLGRLMLLITILLFFRSLETSDLMGFTAFLPFVAFVFFTFN